MMPMNKQMPAPFNQRVETLPPALRQLIADGLRRKQRKLPMRDVQTKLMQQLKSAAMQGGLSGALGGGMVKGALGPAALRGIKAGARIGGQVMAQPSTGSMVRRMGKTAAQTLTNPITSAFGTAYKAGQMIGRSPAGKRMQRGISVLGTQL